MLDEIHDRLMKAKERLRVKQKLEAMLREERSALEHEREKCRLHRKTLASEKVDVEKLDSAKEEARVAQRRLRRFQEELADADQRLHVSLDDIGGFSKFADFFFDGLIADWIVQSKVQKASSACESALRKVSSALNECRRQLSQVEQDAEQVATERRTFVEGA